MCRAQPIQRKWNKFTPPHWCLPFLLGLRTISAIDRVSVARCDQSSVQCILQRPPNLLHYTCLMYSCIDCALHLNMISCIHTYSCAVLLLLDMGQTHTNTQLHTIWMGRSQRLMFFFSIGLNVMLFSIVNYNFLLGVCN